jgi:uncharacterized membrane protein
MIEQTALQLFVLTIIVVAGFAAWTMGITADQRALVAKIQGRPLELRWLATIASLAILIGALWFFCMAPSTLEAAGRGALLGATVTAFHGLTTYSLFADYPLETVGIEIAGGSILCGAAAGAATASLELLKI